MTAAGKYVTRKPGDGGMAETNMPAQGKRLADFLADGLPAAAVVLGFYVFASIVIRIFLADALTLDEAEQSYFSQFWQLGYGPQPPFYNWVQNALVSVMGLSLFTLSLPKFVMLFLCFLFYGLAAREISDRPAFVSLAMLALLTVPQVSYMPQQDLTHTVAVLMATAMFFYGACRLVRRPSLAGYVIVGIAVGIGSIAKYNFLLVPVASAVAMLVDKDMRRIMLDPRLLLATVIAIAIFLPHGVWLKDHMALATQGTVSKMVEANGAHGVLRVLRAFGSLAVACAAFGGATVVILAVAFGRAFRKAMPASDRWSRFLGRFMLISLGGVVVIILSTRTTRITERWLDPYLLALPLYLLAKLDVAGADLGSRLRRLVPLFCLIMAVTLLSVPIKAGVVSFKHSASRSAMPYRTLAALVRSEGEPATIVASDMQLAGNMRMQFPQAAVLDPETLADHDDTTLKGPVLVIDASPAPKPQVLADMVGMIPGGALATASVAKAVALPYLSGGDQRANFRYLWLR